MYNNVVLSVTNSTFASDYNDKYNNVVLPVTIIVLSLVTIGTNIIMLFCQ